MAQVLSIFIVFILVFSLGLCWHWWRISRAYKYFPSRRLDVEFLYQILAGRRPRNVPLTNIIFQTLINVIKPFQAEGLLLLWFVRPMIFIFGGQFMKDLVNDASLGNKSFAYDLNAPVFGNGLMGSKHDVWKVHRKILIPALNTGAVKGKAQQINKHAQLLLKELEAVPNKPTEEVWDILKRCTFSIMEECILGIQLNNKRHENLSQDILKFVDEGKEHIIERILSPWLYWDVLLRFFDSGRKYLKMVKEADFLISLVIKELLMSEIASAKKQHQGEEELDKSAGSILIQHYLQDPNFSQKDVRDHLVSLMVGGYDSLSISMMWCFYLLGHHPEEQDRAYQEVMAVASGDIITYDETCQMKYVDCVIKETLRLYPAGPIYGRRTSNEIQCGKYTIPKGGEIAFMPFMLHRNPHNFPEPEKFDPERFSEDSNIRPWMYVPFAEGYRSCVGKKFAMLEMKILLAHVLRRFRITTLDKVEDSELEWTIFLKPLKQPRLLFELRHET